MITLLQGDQNKNLRCSCLRKYINASDIFLHCLNAEDRFGTEFPETYADVLTITHASKPGQTAGTGEIICPAIINLEQLSQKTVIEILQFRQQ